jgi:hypothetical protein
VKEVEEKEYSQQNMQYLIGTKAVVTSEASPSNSFWSSNEISRFHVRVLYESALKFAIEK